MVTPLVPWQPFALASSGTVTDATVNSITYTNSLYNGCVIIVGRTAETGTSTLAVKLQGYHKASLTYYDVQSASIVTFADGETGVRYVMVYPGIVADAATGIVTLGTNYKYVNGWLPNMFRISVTHGGTSVTNTFAVTVAPLT